MNAPKAGKSPKPTHYKIVCISLYTEDLERLEGLTKTLRLRGVRRVSKSQVVRQALALLEKQVYSEEGTPE